MAREIKLTYWPKPIPQRQHDWEATFEDYEPGCPIGHGRTKEDAINDLMMQVDE